MRREIIFSRSEEGGGRSEITSEGGVCGRRFLTPPSTLLTPRFNNVCDEHRGGFLNVVAAGMEEGIEGELWTAGEVVAIGAPGDYFSRSEE